jgi:hypothetical protein
MRSALESLEAASFHATYGEQKIEYSLHDASSLGSLQKAEVEDGVIGVGAAIGKNGPAATPIEKSHNDGCFEENSIADAIERFK